MNINKQKIKSKRQIFNSFSIFFFLSLIVAGCSRRIPLNASYFNSDSKVGLMIGNHVRYTYSANSAGAGLIGGAIGGAITGIIDASTKPKQKYDSALKVVGPQLNPSERIKQLYISQLEPKGKTIIPVTNEV